MRQLYTSAIPFVFGNTPFHTSVAQIYTEVISGLTSNISGLTSNIQELTSNISLRTSNVPLRRIKIPLYMLASVWVFGTLKRGGMLHLVYGCLCGQKQRHFGIIGAK